MMRKRFAKAGFTIVEVLTAAAVVVVAGAVLYSVTRSISFLSAKNAAINLTHIQARAAIHRAVTEIRDSVSIPQLTDASGSSLGSFTGPAAGISYQQVVAGPYVVWSNAPAGQNQVKISGRTGDPAVSAGMRLIIPAFYVEDDITAVSAASGSPPVRTVTLSKNLTTAITCTNGTPNYVAYYLQRSALIVASNELRYYRVKGSGSYSVVSRNITSPQPFSIEANNNRFVQANFETQDPRILSRGFRSMDLDLALTIPYRFRLTTYQ